jgi:hypothetical protein
MQTLAQCLRDTRLTISTQTDPQIQVVFIVFTHPDPRILPIRFRVDGNQATYVPNVKEVPAEKEKLSEPAKPFKANNKR